MLKLNNKGFAITGILYSVLVLFLMILVSMLSLLSSRQNRLYTLTGTIKEEMETKNNIYIPEFTSDSNDEHTSNPLTTNIGSYFITKYRGKYTFIINGSNTCYSYLPANIIIRINNNQIKYQTPSTDGTLDPNNLDNLNVMTLVGTNCNNTGINSLNIESVYTSIIEE